MKEVFIALGVVVALLVLVRVALFLVTLGAAAVVSRAVGRQALSDTPDTIHLEKAAAGAWQNAGAVLPLLAPLAQRGFHDAGVFRVPEMPGLTLQLLVRSDEGLLAAVYEHPTIGHWVDLGARFADGGSVTYTTSAPSGLGERPDHPIHNFPGLAVTDLLAQARTGMPKRPLAPVTPFTAPKLFEQAYAESIAYRKKRGVSLGEIAEIADGMRDAA